MSIRGTCRHRSSGSGGDLAATLGASAVNGGIAAGAVVGGRAVADHGVAGAALVAAVICAIALPATWATRFLTAPAPGGDGGDTEAIKATPAADGA